MGGTHVFDNSVKPLLPLDLRVEICHTSCNPIALDQPSASQIIQNKTTIFQKIKNQKTDPEMTYKHCIYSKRKVRQQCIFQTTQVN